MGFSKMCLGNIGAPMASKNGANFEGRSNSTSYLFMAFTSKGLPSTESVSFIEFGILGL